MSQFINLKTREGRQRFYQGPTWKAKRILKLQRDPYCAECLKEGVYTIAIEVHHRTDIVDLPTLENATNIEGLESLCKSHHSHRTFQEHRGGFGRKKEFNVFNLKWE